MLTVAFCTDPIRGHNAYTYCLCSDSGISDRGSTPTETNLFDVTFLFFLFSISVLVSLGSYKKVPLTGRFYKQTCLTVWKLAVLSTLLRAVGLQVFLGSGERDLWGLFYKGASPIDEGSTFVDP